MSDSIGGGGGGGGGNGIEGLATDFANSLNVQGGRGGNGGAGTRGLSGAGSAGNGGIGGDGGFAISTSGAALLITNTGTIAGGDGGAGGAGSTSGTSIDGTATPAGLTGAGGTGGAGIVGSNLTISNVGGTIRGGLANGGAGARADAVTFTGGTNVLNYGGSIEGSLAIQAGTLQINAAAGGSTVANTIAGGGALIQNSPNMVILTGTNTFAGGTTFAGGILNAGSAGALGASGPLRFIGGTLQYSAANTTDYSGRFSTDPGQLYSIDTNNQNISYASALSSAGGSLTKLGAGTLTLTGANTYTGGTTFAGGVVTAGSAGALGATGPLNFTGGTLQYSAANTTDYSSRFNAADGQFYNIDTNGQAVTFASALTSTGGSLTKLGVGTLTLAGANTYTGTTTITAGTLSVTGGNTIIDAGRVIFNNAPGTAAALSVAVSEAIGTVEGGNASSAINIAAGQILTVGGGNLDATYAGAVNATGTGRLFKTGTGTQALTGALNGGALIVDGGTLALNGGSFTTGGVSLFPDAPTPAGVAVNDTGTFANAGTITMTGGANDAVQLRGGTFVNNGSLAGAGGSGVFAPLGGIVRNSGSASISGVNGIFFGNLPGANSLTVTGGGAVTGTGGYGIFADNGTSNVTLGTVNAGEALGAVTGTGQNALFARTTGAGVIDIVTGGAVTSTTTDAIVARSEGTGAATVTLGTGSIVTGASAGGGNKGAGVRVVSTGGGTGTINVTGNAVQVTGDQPALLVQTTNANAAINITGTGGTFTGSSGLVTDQQGTGAFASTITLAAGNTVAFNTVDATDAYNGQGIFAGNQGTGTTSISTGAGSVTGNANGLVLVNTNVANASAATLTAGGNITAQGAASTVPTAYQGTITAGVFGATTTGYGVLAVNAGTGTLDVNTGGGTIQTQGANAIQATQTNAAAGLLTVNNASALQQAGATLAGTALGANSAGTGGISVTNSGAISGPFVNGIVAGTTGGNLSVDNQAGGTIGTFAARLAGVGILAQIQNAGAGTVTVSNTAAVNAGTFGIQALTDGGGNVVVTNSGSVTAAGTGISATTAGAGSVSVLTSGPVSSIGSGIVASGTSGAVAVTANGSVTSVGGGNAGIFLTGNSVGNAVTTAFGQTVRGNIGLRVAGTGTTALTNGGTIASNVAGGNALQIDGGTLVIGNTAGTLTGNLAVLNGTAVAPNGVSVLTIDRTADLTLANTITGAGIVNKLGSSTLTLTGVNSASNGQFTGLVNVNAGTLAVNGTLGNTDPVGLLPANSAIVNVNNGGTLQGTGTIAGSVVVNSGGTVSAGNPPGTPVGPLAVAGNYTVGAGSTNIFQLGTPNVVGGATNDLITVGGNLAINGGTASLQNVNASGLYRLYNVGGTVSTAAQSNAGFAAVTATNGAASIYTLPSDGSSPSQVNARVSLGGQVVQFWDGTDVTGVQPSTTGTAGARGGAGTWSATNGNWTEDPVAGQINQPWQRQFGVFSAPGGAVRIIGSQDVQGLQFAGNGYVLSTQAGDGGAINLVGDPVTGPTASLIRVDGGVSTEISAPITGLGLNKAFGGGTLVLSGTNTFSSLDINDGTVEVRGGGAIADAAPVTVANVAGARLLVTTTETIGSLAGGGTGGRVDIAAGQTLITGANNGTTTFAGTIADVTTNGALTKTGTGTFTLTGANTYTGDTTIAQGTLVNNGSLTSLVRNAAGATFVNNGSVAASHANAGTSTNNGTISGEVVNGGGFINNGGVGGRLTNSGTATNNGSIGGGVTNTATFTNNATGVVNGGLNNTAGTTFNIGTINNGATVAVGSTLTSTGVVNGGITNSGAVNAQGQANGFFTNSAGAAFTVTGALTGIGRLTNDGTVNLGGNNLTIGSLAGATAAATIGNGGTLTAGGDGTASDYRGGVVGAGTALTKVGTGTLTLSGNNTYGGATTIQAGTLAVAGTGIINGSSQIQNNAGFTIAAGGQVTTPQLTNAASGTVTTAGTLTATTAISNAGNFTVSAGTVTTPNLTNAGTLSQGGGTINATAFDNAAGATFSQSAGALNTATIINGGSFTSAGTVAATSQFTNNGTLAASGTVTTPTFINVGTVNGLLTLAGVSQITNQSGALIRDGVSISTAAGGAVLDNAGTIGTGGLVINLASGTLTANNTSGRTFFGFVSSAAGTTSTFNNTATGAWRYQGNGQLSGTDTINNAGLFEVTAAGGVLNGLERFNNLSGGQVALNGALAGAIATVDNAGTVNLNGNALTGVGTFFNRNSLVMAGGTLGATTLNNSGTIVASGTLNTTTFDNSGTVSLLGNLGGATGTLNNTGLVNLATSSNFTGIGTLNNVGVIGNRQGNSYNGAFGVGTFNNLATGQINLQNNQVTDTLALSGAYVGTAGSRLAIDVDLSRADAGTRADVLQIGGSNSGQSFLTLNPVSTQRVFFATPIPVVQTAGGGSGQLQVDPSTPLLPSGFITYSLQQTPGSAGSYEIVSRIDPSQAATSVAGISGLITSLNVGFFQSINAFISGPAEHKICTDLFRDAKLCEQQAPASVGVTTSDKSWSALNQQAAAAPVAAEANESGILPNTLGFGLWGRGSGGETTIRSASTADFGGGVSLTGQNRTRIGFAGFQFGGDVAVFNIGNSGFNLHVGVTGGEVYANGREQLSSQASGQFSVPFVGAYAAVTSGPFTSDISFRHDFYNARFSDPVAGVQNRMLPIGSDTWGASAGYRFDLPNLFGGEQAFFVEPSGSISYTQTRIGTLPVTGGFLNFDNIDSILGRIGFRVGTTFVAGDKLALQPFATASVWNEFAGDALSRFIPTASAAALQQGQSAFFVPILTNRVGTFGQVGVGVTGQLLGTDLLGFVRGDLRFGDRIDGYSINGGVRYPF
ncbi:autotransporter-associated beta strand repeat-containing protein [Methylorubrum aminovorans]